MIDINTLETADMGRYVVYNSGRKAEVGRIKSWNEHNVFVVYTCGDNWDNYMNYTACATDPSNLCFFGGRVQ